MQRIVPCLWFDHKAVEAVNYYTSVFPDGRVTDTQYYPSQGLLDFQQEFAGSELSIEFEIAGFRMMAINAGPEFQVNPSVSFMVNFDPHDGKAVEYLDALWAALTDGGQELMPLGEYSFSRRYGWVQDRYGVSWQLLLTAADAEPQPLVVPCLMFANIVQNRAGEALEYYQSVFPEARVGTVVRYLEQTGPAVPGAVTFATIDLLGQRIAVMDAGAEQEFTFNSGVSLIVECADQAEINRYWAALSEVPEAEQCGWCVDRFGLSWQIVPVDLEKLMQTPGSFEKLMQMKKIDIAAFG